MKTIIFLGMVLFSTICAAQETTRTYEEEVVYHLVEAYPGEVTWLSAGGRDFLGLFRKATTGYSKRAAVILHSMGAHADWPDVIGPLRTALPDRGWATLSIQLPVLSPDVPHAEYGRTFRAARERIQAALRHLEENGYPEVVLVGYGFGAASALNYLVQDPEPVDAFIGISMQSHLFLNPPYELTGHLSELMVPTLDIYGSGDFSGVVRSVDDRRLAGSRLGSPPYDQRVIEGANHYFTGAGGDLAGEIADWLESVVPDLKPVKLGGINYF